jgi:hypothetical protein
MQNYGPFYVNVGSASTDKLTVLEAGEFLADLALSE